MTSRCVRRSFMKAEGMRDLAVLQETQISAKPIDYIFC